MTICEEHEEIVYAGKNCPMCAVIEDNNGLSGDVERLTKELDEAKEAINSK